MVEAVACRRRCVKAVSCDVCNILQLFCLCNFLTLPKYYSMVAAALSWCLVLLALLALLAHSLSLSCLHTLRAVCPRKQVLAHVHGRSWFLARSAHAVKRVVGDWCCSSACGRASGAAASPSGAMQRSQHRGASRARQVAPWQRLRWLNVQPWAHIAVRVSPAHAAGVYAHIIGLRTPALRCMQRPFKTGALCLANAGRPNPCAGQWWRALACHCPGAAAQGI